MQTESVDCHKAKTSKSFEPSKLLHFRSCALEECGEWQQRKTMPELKAMAMTAMDDG